MQFLRCMWKLVLESCQWKNNSLYRILVTEPWKSLEDSGRGILSLWQFFRATRVGADSFLSGRVVEPAFKCANVDPTWREHGKLLPSPLSPEGERAQESGKKTSYQERGWIKLMVLDLSSGARCSELRTHSEDALATGLLRRWVSAVELYAAVKNDEILPFISPQVCSFIITSFQKLTGVPWELNQILHSALSAMTNSDAHSIPPLKVRHQRPVQPHWGPSAPWTFRRYSHNKSMCCNLVIYGWALKQ